MIILHVQKLFFLSIIAFFSERSHSLNLPSLEKVFQFNQIYSRTKKLNLSQKPHIIYITVERYTNNENLKNYYGFHNLYFNDFLNSHNFHVWNNQKANYPTSLLTNISTLNMSYVDQMIRTVNFEHKYPVVSIVYYILNNQVQKILRHHGYSYYFFHSEYGLVSQNDNWINKKWIKAVLENTSMLTMLLSIISTKISIRALLYKAYYNIGLQKRCQRVYNQEKQIIDILKRNQPVFTWWLLYFTHPPYIYDKSGKCLNKVNLSEQNWNKRKNDYIDQIKIANNVIMDFIKELSIKSSRPFIIIIQGDEGPATLDLENVLHQKQSSIWDKDIKDIVLKLGIFNAIYLPSENYLKFNNYKSPINNFHIIFNEIFKNYKGNQKPDKYYLYRNYYHVLDLKEFK